MQPYIKILRRLPKNLQELKILIRNNITPQTDSLMATMRDENAQTLSYLLAEKPKALRSLHSYAKSHVGAYSVIVGGGNSMDFSGTAQVGPNYDDVSAAHGSKSYIDTAGLFAREGLRDAIAERVFGPTTVAEDLSFLTNDEDRDNYAIQFIASHELGHMYLGDSNIEDIEEAKATWTGMIALWEREKNGKLPPGTAAKMMKGHVKCVLQALGDEEMTDYRKEAIMNIKIFLQVGLLSHRDAGWEFHADKIPDAYEAIKAVWLKFTDEYVAANQDGEDSPAYASYRAGVRETITETQEIKSLSKLVRKGIGDYNKAQKTAA